VIDFFAVEQWPVGPPWFIWVLFVFNAIFALIYAFNKSLSRAGAPAHTHASTPQPRTYKPGLVAALWFLLTFALFVPFAFWLGPGTWTGFGPFDFQVSRAALYFGYFLLGAWLGTGDFNEGLFSFSSPLVRRWPLWLIACGGIYTLLTISPPFLTELVKDGKLSELTGYLIYFSIYTASCTFSCIAFMTAFRALAKKENAIWDSLSEHAYLIYLIHYPFVIWAQYLLLNMQLPAFSKFSLAFLFALAGSWAVSIPLKKIGLVKKYI
jgi:glucans biosynthesis protein C